VTYALLCGGGAALASAALGYPLIAWLRARGLGKSISAEGPESHMSKAGTPTMGGLLFVGVALAVMLALGVPRDADILLPAAALAVLAAVGLYDDLGTLVGRERREAHDRVGMLLKLAAFAVVGAGTAALLYGPLDAPRLLVPHYGAYDIGPLYIVVAAGVIVATTASVGVSDGLDTLLGGTATVAFCAYGVLGLMQDSDAIAIACFGLAGALLGFLWHNAYPARLFMGDTGSLALGAALAVVALQSGWWLLLPVVGVVYVAEGLSDVIQIGYFRTTGRRFFRMAPLHHHFEKLGLPETRISLRFIMVGVVGAFVAIALAALD
jgi:phospho-N-acetylmuramoyl-pentapeptide-transferase